MKQILSSLTFFMLIAYNANADIYECNGVVTNKPCEGGKVIGTEVPYQAPDPKRLEEQKKFGWIQTLSTARADAKNRYNLDVNIDTVRDICNTEPIEKCRDAVSAKEREINELVTARIGADAAKKSNQTTPAQDKTTIINIKDDSDQALIGDPFGLTPKPMPTKQTPSNVINVPPTDIPKPADHRPKGKVPGLLPDIGARGR